MCGTSTLEQAALECYHVSYGLKIQEGSAQVKKYFVRFDLFSLITAAVPLAGLRHPRVRITSHFLSA